MNMGSFVDEYMKIAASSKSAPSPKVRIGKRPIRVHNLIKKADVKQEAAKAVAKGGGVRGLLSRIGEGLLARKKGIGYTAAGAVGAKAGEEYLLEPWQYGRKAREMGAQF
jgi:hypothetical protein